jgi:hypothetical protein
VEFPSNPFCTPKHFQAASPSSAPSEASFGPDIQGDVNDMSFDPDVTKTSPNQLIRKLEAKIKN